MGYLATGEIFENMLQLKRFGLHFVKKKIYYKINILKEL